MIYFIMYGWCMFKGDEETYYSIDSIDATDEAERINFPIEFLNSLTPTGMPPRGVYTM